MDAKGCSKTADISGWKHSQGILQLVQRNRETIRHALYLRLYVLRRNLRCHVEESSETDKERITMKPLPPKEGMHKIRVIKVIASVEPSHKVKVARIRALRCGRFQLIGFN